MSSGPPPLPTRRSGCLTVFMIIAGLILLLPGLCAIIFGFSALSSSNLDPGTLMLVLFGVFVGFLGIMLLRAAEKDPRG
jgi:hypothetical protein